MHINPAVRNQVQQERLLIRDIGGLIQDHSNCSHSRCRSSIHQRRRKPAAIVVLHACDGNAGVNDDLLGTGDTGREAEKQGLFGIYMLVCSPISSSSNGVAVITSQE